MLLSHSHRLLSFPFPFSHSYNPLLSLPLNFIHRPTSLHSVSAHSRPRPRPDPWLVHAAEPTTATTTAVEEGPVELPLFSNSIFADTDDPSPIEVATSVFLTGAVSVFLFRSLRRRAKRVKELKFRSSGAKESLKEEAMDSLKAMGSASIEAKSPSSALQALFGGISAGIIALILYKFTTTIEAALNGQTISDNFSGELIFFIFIKKQHFESCSADNNNYKDNCEWVVLPCNLCFRHQLSWFISIFWPARPELLHGRFFN